MRDTVLGLGASVAFARHGSRYLVSENHGAGPRVVRPQASGLSPLSLVLCLYYPVIWQPLRPSYPFVLKTGSLAPSESIVYSSDIGASTLTVFNIWSRWRHGGLGACRPSPLFTQIFYTLIGELMNNIYARAIWLTMLTVTYT